MSGCDALVLLDNESSHSFLDEGMVKGIRTRVVSNKPLTVMVANGQKITSGFACPDVTYIM